MLFNKNKTVNTTATLITSACFGIVLLGFSSGSLAADQEVEVEETEITIDGPGENSGPGTGVKGQDTGAGVGIVGDDGDSSQDECTVANQCVEGGSLLDDARQLSPQEEADAISNGWSS